MSKPEVAEHVTPRFYMFSYPFLLLQELGEANTLQDNKLNDSFFHHCIYFV